MKICFEDGFNGLVNIGDQNIRIGVNGAKPYDFTFTAAASCFYSTLLTNAPKFGVEIEAAELEVSGEKRIVIPTTLEHFAIHAKIVSDASEDELKTVVRVAEKACSMLETLRQGAKVEVTFEKVERLSKDPIIYTDDIVCDLKGGSC